MSYQPPYPRKKRTTKRKIKAPQGATVPLESTVQKNLIRYTLIKYKAPYSGLKCFGNPLSSMDLSNMRNKHAFVNHCKAMGWDSGQPDFYLDQPNTAFINGTEYLFHGLRIELKRTEKDLPFYFMPRKKIYLIDNETEMGSHLREQASYLAGLREKNYAALFAAGQQQGQDVIDWYLGSKKLEFEKFQFTGTKYIPQQKWIWKVK